MFPLSFSVSRVLQLHGCKAGKNASEMLVQACLSIFTEKNFHTVQI